MAHLEARPVDPRDAGWEVWDPAYRVYFWSQRPTGAWSSRVLEVTNTDVAAVLTWADQQADGAETYQVFAVAARDGAVGLIRLLGVDPTRS